MASSDKLQTTTVASESRVQDISNNNKRGGWDNWSTAFGSISGFIGDHPFFIILGVPAIIAGVIIGLDIIEAK
jgi:hypothetical protein